MMLEQYLTLLHNYKAPKPDPRSFFLKANLVIIFWYVGVLPCNVLRVTKLLSVVSLFNLMPKVYSKAFSFSHVICLK